MGGFSSSFGGVAQPAATQSVPAAPQQQTAYSGVDPVQAELIKNITAPIDPNLIHAALNPGAGAHSAQLPSSLQRPIAPYQERPMNNNPVVGHKQGRLQGIGNAITGATNAIGTVMNKEAQMKQDQTRDAATKVIMAQQSIDEAKQAHDAAIANGDATAASKAQELIQQNTQARDAVFADPKMRKALAKGFDISYTDPSQNKTEEHTAVQAAMKQAKTLQEKKQILQQQQQKDNAAAGQAAGEAYAKAQPQGLAPNTAAQQQLQLIQSQKALTQETLKNYQTFKASAMHANATVSAAMIHTQGAAMMEQAKMQQQQQLLAQRFQQQLQMQNIRYKDDISLIGVRAAAAQRTAMAIYTDKEADPLTMYNKTRTAAETYSKNYMHDLDTYNKMSAGRASFYVDSKGNQISESKVDQEGVKAYDNQVATVKAQVELDKANAENFTRQANNLRDSFGISEGQQGGEEDSNGRTDSTSDTDSIGAPDDTSSYLD
jgi:hypothetical protein